MLDTIRKVLGRLTATLLLLTLQHAANALPWLTLTPTQAMVSASAGGSINLIGSIINRTNTALDSTDLFLNFDDFEPGVLTPWQTLGMVPFSIPSFSFRDQVALFTVDIAADALPGLQTLNVVLQDVSGNFSDPVNFTFLIDPTVAVPEPATLAIMLAGLPLLMRRRTPTAHGGHHG